MFVVNLMADQERGVCEGLRVGGAWEGDGREVVEMLLNNKMYFTFKP